jgi:hypothetical protein
LILLGTQERSIFMMKETELPFMKSNLMVRNTKRNEKFPQVSLFGESSDVQIGRSIVPLARTCTMEN